LGHLSQCCEAFNARASLSFVEIQALCKNPTLGFLSQEAKLGSKIPAHFGKAKSLQQMYYDLGQCIYIMMALSKANLVSAFCEANKAKFRVPKKE